MATERINTQLKVFQGDITQLEVEVIVNAANARLAGGGGVDGAIHRAAGDQLYVACREIGACPTGGVRETPGFNLKAKAIFHAVGPVWYGGNSGEGELLASCYRDSIELAKRKKYASIAFPAISCGVYGFPLEQAAAIAVNEVKKGIENAESLQDVTFCCFDQTTTDIYQRRLQNTSMI